MDLDKASDGSLDVLTIGNLVSHFTSIRKDTGDDISNISSFRCSCGNDPASKHLGETFKINLDTRFFGFINHVDDDNSG